MSLRGLYNLYRYDIPVPGPHIGSGKNSQENRKKAFTGDKKEKTFRRATDVPDFLNVT